tara:strand:- start:89 stop:514 length:426 start_codon:yes stop_codon:yes gene_type:complete
MTDYDNTDRGSLFKPRADESLLVQGKLNSDGDEFRLVVVKASLPDGGTARDVYQKVGTMYENDKSLNEKSPDFSGPITLQGQDKRRIAAWKTVSKDGNTKFLSCRIGDSTPRQNDVTTTTEVETESNEVILGGENPDDIPF